MELEVDPKHIQTLCDGRGLEKGSRGLERPVRTWSSNQATVALSSGEAEHYALVRAAAEGIGMQALLRDLGFDSAVRLGVDASAAKALASRTGLGKVRLMETQFLLWLQEAV